MMLLIKFYKEVIAAFNKFNVEYIIVGGYAVSFHGYVRGTVDLDNSDDFILI